jgi:RNA polymerase sigma-70 factor (ECF subfamily)
MNYATSKFSHLTDNELVNEYKRTNNKELVGELYKRYTHLVLGMCIHYFKDKDNAKDMVVQIFEKLFQELKKREVENFKAWLTFVVRNYCISELRKVQTQKTRIQAIEYELQQANTNNENQEDETELQIQKLELVLHQLNPFQKKCIELFYYKNMTYSQIVELTGYSINEVKSYIQNGKRNLKLLMTEVK